MRQVTPLYKPLTDTDVRQIDRAARQILQRVGFKVKDPDFLMRLEQAGAQVDSQNHLVRFDDQLLNDLISLAPTHFTLYARDGKNNLYLGDNNVYFGNGGRVFQILDMGTGGYRRTMLRDVAHTARIVNHLSNLSFYIIACQAHDSAPEYYHLNDFYYAFCNTLKHVMGGCDTLEGARQMWKLAAFIAGGEEELRERPFVSVITNPISPLTIDSNTIRTLDFLLNKGIPVTCAPAPICGTTSPATLAGTLAQMHAEALAGVAFTQVMAPGALVMYGSVSTSMDLRRMEFTMGSVEAAMMNACAVQLAKLYNLPIYASAGVTEAKIPDIQAGFEKCLSGLLVAMAGGDYVHLAAGMLDSGNSISYEQYLLDDEWIGMTYRVLEGIQVDSGTLAVDVIEKVGAGGNYVLEDHTVNYMMQEFFYPNLSIRCNFDIWEEKGRPTPLTRAHSQVREILKSPTDNILDKDLNAEILKRFAQIQKI